MSPFRKLDLTHLLVEFLGCEVILVVKKIYSQNHWTSKTGLMDWIICLCNLTTSTQSVEIIDLWSDMLTWVNYVVTTAS